MDIREETMLNGGSRTDRAIIEQLYKNGGGATATGVISFNGRTGIVTPKEGDYTAEQVKALSIDGGTLNGSLIVVGSVAEGADTIASGAYSHAEGRRATDGDESVRTEAIGGGSHAEGAGTKAEGASSHAEGFLTKALNSYAHAEGRRTVSEGNSSHAEGYMTTASGAHSHAEGDGTVAAEFQAHAEGCLTQALGYRSHASGYSTIAHSYETAIGRWNVDSNTADTNTLSSDTCMLIVGNGSSSVRSNILRVTQTDIFGSASFNSSGADYAEMFEWEDGNPNGEDRVGRFVTLNGSKIRIATASDDFILGIVSATPSIVGDNHSDQWKSMYERDIFGRIIFDEGNVNDISKEDEEVFDRIKRINPAYNKTERYIARSSRPEWAPIGLLGKLVMIDDGTCRVNGWCKPTIGGLATTSVDRTRYRVMERLDASHVLILIL